MRPSSRCRRARETGWTPLNDALVSAGGVACRCAGRDGPVRLPIDRVFSDEGLRHGRHRHAGLGTRRDRAGVGASCRQRRDVRVRGLQVHGRTAGVGRGRAGAWRSISAASRCRTWRAGTRSPSADAFEPTRRLDARLELLPAASPLRHGARVRFHCGTAELLGRVALTARSGVRACASRPEGTASRAEPYARIHLEAPAVVTRGDRFILRAYSPLATIGGGVVLDPRPPRARFAAPPGLERLRRLDVRRAERDAGAGRVR